MQQTQEYVIFAEDRSRGSDHAVWWGPNRCGYTTVLERAGRYTREEAERLECTHEGEETIAVPLELAMEVALRVVPRISVSGFLKSRIYRLRQDAR